MGQLSAVLRNVEGGGLMFWCAGCCEAHRVWVGDGPGPRWGWNGNAERPTFTPSVLVTGRDFTEKGEADLEAWYDAGCPDRRGVEFESVPVVCHSFVTDGRIQYLSDCTHALAGQTINLPAWPEHGTGRPD